MTAGTRVGRWTVLDDAIDTPSGKKYRCRCDCGTERYVLERSLKYGGSLSCGCRTRELARQSCAYELLGQRFGSLTVVGRSRKRVKRGILWTCLCDCGYTCEASSSELVSGRKTHCGCKASRAPVYTNISNQTFGRLTALHPTAKRKGRGSVVWHCRCTCGREVDVSYNELVYGTQQSCGCQKKEHDQLLGTFLTHVAGTSVDMLKSKKLPSDNTTGYKGVYLVRGKYLAKIVFQKKQYILGFFDKIEDAAAARKEAEAVLFDGVAEHYQRWKQLADQDPQWAEENPFSVLVDQVDKKLHVTLLPDLHGREEQ